MKPEDRGLEKPPRGHLDDRANFDDDKDNETRPVGTFARFATTHGGRSKSQLHRWCVCDQRDISFRRVSESCKRVNC